MKTQPMKHQVKGEALLTAAPEFYALGAEQGTGKAQPTDCLVATPSGWRNLGDISVGDFVLAGDGKPTTVVGVYPQGEQDSFLLRFSDGTSTRCTSDHLWVYSDADSRNKARSGRHSEWKVGPLSEFSDRLTSDAGLHLIKTPYAEPLQFASRDLLIQPYVLGVLLGDGCIRNCASFTSADPEIPARVQSLLPSARISTNGINHNVCDWLDGISALEELELLGCYSHEKFVPDDYLLADADARRELLRGLMDADGTVENGTAVFGSTSRALADCVVDLTRSLGGRARITTRPAGTYKKENGELGPRRACWRVRLSFADNFVPFHLTRKAALFKPHTKYKPRRRTLVSVEFAGRSECVCIAVEHHSRTYITDDCIVTHNTWMLLNDAERQFESGDIDALFVIAPKGVHTNWVRREIPTHLSVANQAAYWLSGGGKKRRAAVDRLLRQEPGEELLVLTMNVDAVNTAAGFETAKKFLTKFRCMMVVDESQRIKNLTAQRTKRTHNLGKLAVSRRIASGTLVADNPLDLFAQYEFLQSGLLGTTSFRAFTAEFADVLPAHHPLVREIMARSRGRGAPQVIRRTPDGNPVFRNLEKLRALIMPHTYRVLKKDCLDLPEKIYQTHFFELTPAQRKLYNQVKADMRYTRDDGTIDTFTALTAINKLRQVTSGFILVDGEATSMDASARLAALTEVLEDVSGQVIIWASFREEIAQISAALKDTPHVQYHGGTSASEREEAVDAFQRGDVRVFIANPAAGGTGLTLTAANTAIYYSNSFSLEERLQSEDRCHRIGTREPVIYIDLVAQDTTDERIAAALQAKSVVAAQILDGA